LIQEFSPGLIGEWIALIVVVVGSSQIVVYLLAITDLPR
jgi:hypothetical protein